MSWDLISEEVICNNLESQQTTIFAFSKKIKELIKELEAKNVELERSREFVVKFFKDKCDKLLMSGGREAELKCIAEKKLEIAVEALEFYAKTESWEAGWIANADLHEPWGDQGISLGGKCAIEALKIIREEK